MRPHLAPLLCAFGVVLAFLVLPAFAAAAETFVVNTAKDGEELPVECGPVEDEQCLTLREAIELSNENESSEPNTISFAGIPAGSRIEIEGPFADIFGGVTIDGDTAVGATAGIPAIELVPGPGFTDTEFASGLSIRAGEGTTVEGMAIGGFGAGIGLGPTEGGIPIGTQICGNYLGVELDGETAIPNEVGVEVGGNPDERPETTAIGNGGSCAGNVISGNSFYGVVDEGLETTIAGNRIGIGSEAADGPILPNGELGIETEESAGVLETETASGGMIGGPLPGGGEVNLISYNAGPGVRVEGSAGEISIRRNSFTENQGKGIEIVGGTPPAPPTITTAESPAAGNLVVEGTVTGTIGESVDLDFFGNPACDPSGAGEGQTILGSTVQPIESRTHPLPLRNTGRTARRREGDHRHLDPGSRCDQ